MKQKKYILHLVLISCIFTSCSSRIKFNNQFDKTSSFYLKINTTNKSTGLTQTILTKIAVASKKHSKLIDWLNKNESGWQITPASYVADISISQGSFNLMYLKGSGGAVISFIDKENKPRQYSKTIKKGELDFLVVD